MAKKYMLDRIPCRKAIFFLKKSKKILINSYIESNHQNIDTKSDKTLYFFVKLGFQFSAMKKNRIRPIKPTLWSPINQKPPTN